MRYEYKIEKITVSKIVCLPEILSVPLTRNQIGFYFGTHVRCITFTKCATVEIEFYIGVTVFSLNV